MITSIKEMFYHLISSRITAVILITVTAIAALYLSSIGDKISYNDQGIVHLQISASVESFEYAKTAWSAIKRQMAIQYLSVDILLALICAFSFPSAAIILSECTVQYPGDRIKHLIRYTNTIRRFVMIMSPITSGFAIIGNLLIINFLSGGKIIQTIVFISFAANSMRYLLVIISLLALLSLILIKKLIARSA